MIVASDRSPAIATDRSLTAGMRFLAACQQRDGHWSDYELPVGSSDAWVTAYVAVAMAQAATATSARDASESAARGAAWLAQSRPYPRGWGFNARTGPDADSTAWALRALAATGLPIDETDVDFLLAHWTEAGGVATYAAGPAHWADPHPDVTPVAMLALPEGRRQSVLERTLRYVAGAREPCAGWSGYWWTTAHYPTLLNIELLAALGALGGNEGPVVEDRPGQRITSVFDLACVVHAAALLSPGAGRALAPELIASQAPSGGWPPSRTLRVTQPDCSITSSSCRGTVYADVHGIYTTATAVRALAACLS